MDESTKDAIAQSMGLENAQATTEPQVDTPASPATNVETPQAQVATPEQAPQPAQAEPQQPQEPTVGFDENGNPVIDEAFINDVLKDVSDEPQQEPAHEEEVATEQSTEQTQPASPALDPNTMVTVKVDGVEQQIPLQEALNGYMRQADYTRKSQALAQQRQQYQQPQYQPPKPQPTPQEQAAANQQRLLARKEQLQKYDAFAKDQVKQMFGEEYNEYDDVQKAAYNDVMDQIRQAERRQEQQVQQKQQAEQQRQQALQGLYNKYAADPNFSAIDDLAQRALDNMPYRVSNEIRQAFNTGDVNKIDAFYKAVQDNYYGRGPQKQVQQPAPKPIVQQPAQPKVKPPFVESSSPATSPVEQKFNVNTLHTMTNDQQAKTVAALMQKGFI